jgi:hypothetical protein
LPFKSENHFAQGHPRRPRKHPTNEGLRGVIARTMRCPPVSPPLPIPIEDQAFHYFVANFTTWPNDMPDIGHDYLTYALYHWNSAGPGSSLHLAVSAFSHAVFWRGRRISQALENADRFYVRSIMKTQKEIKELSTESIDHLVVATLLMTNYEVCPGLRPLKCPSTCANSLIDLYVRSK